MREKISMIKILIVYARSKIFNKSTCTCFHLKNKLLSEKYEKDFLNLNFLND